MDQATEALWGLVAGALSPEHWPFLSVFLILVVLGQISSTRVFTRERAHLRREGRAARFWHGLFWWGRETLPGHPIAIGFLLACAWQDPEGKGWPWIASAAYWMACGAASLFGWVILKGIAKHRGIELTLPGDSSRPPK